MALGTPPEISHAGLRAARATLGNSRHTAAVLRRIAMLTCVLVIGVSCSSSVDDTQAPDPSIASVPAADVGGPSANLGDFCERFVALGGERPEEYVGSSEHLDDIESLLAVAPMDASDDLAIYRDYIASGAIDSNADPDSNLFDRWPADVQSAVLGVQAFGAENC